MTYTLAPISGLRPAAYASDEDPPPPPVPDDPLAAQPEGQHPEISINVDTRDGHLTLGLVTNWGPGKTPFLYQTYNNSTPPTGTSAAGAWHLNQAMEIRHAQGAGSILLREADGTLSSYKQTAPYQLVCGAASGPGVTVFEHKVGTCARIETTYIRVGEDSYWSGV